MKTFKIEVIETYSRIIEVSALSKADALQEVRDMYSEGEIVLAAEDFNDNDIVLYEE